VCGDKVQGRVVARVLAGLEVANLFFVFGEAVGCGRWMWSVKGEGRQRGDTRRDVHMQMQREESHRQG